MHFAHRLSDNTTSCQLRSEESALSCPRRPVARSRRIAHRKRAFSPIRPIKKCSLRKERLHFWGVLLKYRWRVVGCGVPDAPCTARKFGAAPDACTCHCRGAACRSRRCTCSPYRPPSKWHAPIASVAALSERHAGWQSLRHTFCGVKFSSLSLRGGRRPTWRPEREARGSALGVQSREGSCDFADGFPTMRPGTARLPRRFAPRNDTSGEREVHQCPPAV